MLDLSIIYVTYNSAKWIEACFASVMRSDYDLKKLSIYVVDNASTDNTLTLLQATKAKCKDRLSSFTIISKRENHGFGKANNIGFSKANTDIVCFFNIDTELESATLRALSDDIERSPSDFALWELRQFPYEHPKMYDPLTRETSWSSAAAIAVRRDVYARLGGFDEKIFMYAEDVDLSWRIRSHGYKLRFVPKSVINHYSYDFIGQQKPLAYVNCIANNLMLRYRFGSYTDILEGHRLIEQVLASPEAYRNSKEQLLATLDTAMANVSHFSDRSVVGDCKDFAPKFLGFDYEMVRTGYEYRCHFPKSEPLVSIIVRTCGRPDVLRETLISLREQTYKNIEIVIAEDGPSLSQSMIEAEFSDLNIIYRATGEHVGRCKAGNLALSMATGKYMNFLDDDDIFFADHVEVLVAALEKSDELLAYTYAFETPIDVYCKSPYKYKVHGYNRRYEQSFDKIMLCHHNYLPIQSIMFDRSLYEKYGGFDENIPTLEDYDLWLTYMYATDFKTVPKTTSMYRVPGDAMASEQRHAEVISTLELIRKKHGDIYPKLRVKDVALLYEKIEELKIESERPTDRNLIKGFFQCIKDHGFIYTVKRAINRVLGR